MTEAKTYITVNDFTIGIDESRVQKFFKEKPQDGLPPTSVKVEGHSVYIDGRETDLDPGKIRIAIREKWLQPEGGNIVEHTPPAAGVKMSAATPQQEDKIHQGATNLMDEERVVHSVNQRKDFRGDSTVTDVTNNVDTRSSNTSVMDGGRTNSKQSHAEKHQGRGQIIESGVGSEGADIGVKFSTPAQSKTDLSKVSTQDVHSMVNQLSKPITPQQPKTAGMAPAKSVPRKVTEGITFENHNVGDRSAIGRDAGDVTVESGNPFADDARVVGSVGQSGGTRKQREQVTSPQRQVAQPVEEAEPKKDVTSSVDKYSTLRMVHPELPEWDFSQNWRTKLARLEEYAEDSLVMRSIYVSEDNFMQEKIAEKFEM